MIDTNSKLAAFAGSIRTAPWIALDTEADSLHAYPEKICLIQISLAGSDDLVDPLAAVDLTPLWEVLRGRELLLHGADYDLRLFRKHHGFVPHRIFDTMLAARLLGITRFGLSDLVQQFLGVQLEKGPQKADWARRPLTERMEVYARNDTRYLKPLVDILHGQLVEKGRLAWQEESCARLVADCAELRPLDPDTVWRIKGSFKLRRPALTILRELWQWRETEAIAANRPPFFILSHETLIAVADAVAHQEAVDPLLPPRLHPRRRDTLSAAIKRGLAVPPEQHPTIPQTVRYYPSVEEKRRFEKLQAQRDKHAAGLSIDPTLIASRAQLEELARDWAANHLKMMNWQLQLLAPTPL